MKVKKALNFILNVFVILLLGICIIVLTALYLKTFSYNFLNKYYDLILYLTTCAVCIMGIIALICSFTYNKFIYKLTIVTLGVISVVLAVLYFLKISGILEKIDSIEALRNYVASFGYMAVFIYIVLNVLQVVILPIPGFISVLAGVALFGPFKTSIFALLGILIGSLIAFFIGRYLGYKVVSWLITKETLDKWLNRIKNKDKIILTFMFLFPFFPDDVLCFVAGLSSMSNTYFIIMITVCRIVSVFTTAYSINGNIIPYNTWWGLTLWGIIFILTIMVSAYIYKNGDKLEKKLKSKFKIKGK